MLRNISHIAAGAKPWYRIEAAAKDEAEIYIYGEIGLNFWGEGIGSEQFIKDLNAIKAKTINVRINSVGGSVFEGLAIYNALERAKSHATVNTHVDSIAASIASIIALAGEKVHIASNAFMMVHNPHTIVWGNASDMREMAHTLDKIRDSLVGIYAKKSGKESSEVEAWLDGEKDGTWFSAEEALEAGLVDVIGGQNSDAKAQIGADIRTVFPSVPAEIAATLQTDSPEPNNNSDNVRIAALIQRTLATTVAA